MRLFGKIKHAFHITGRGCVIIPEDLQGLTIRAGVKIELRLSDHSTLCASIVSIELATGHNGADMAFVLGSKVDPKSVPPGTEIWVS